MEMLAEQLRKYSASCQDCDGTPIDGIEMCIGCDKPKPIKSPRPVTTNTVQTMEPLELAQEALRKVCMIPGESLPKQAAECLLERLVETLKNADQKAKLEGKIEMLGKLADALGDEDAS